MSETLENLRKSIEKAAQSAGIDAPVVNLEHPDDISHGDFSTNMAMIHAKNLKVNPKVLAEKIVEELKKDLPKSVEKVELAGPGFINFTFYRSYFVDEIAEIIQKGKKYGQKETKDKKTILVEYSSPNIAKPFSIGHLRSTIIGDAIANILEFEGYKIIRDNHLGDWGTQFGKLLVAIEKWGNLAEVEKSEHPIKELVALYVRFHSEAEKIAEGKPEGAPNPLEEAARLKFKALEEGSDAEAISIWKKCIDLSQVEFNKIYNTLGVKFDTEIGESFYATKVMTETVEKALTSKNLLQDSEGARVVFFEGEKYPPLIVEKSDGTSIYATRDLAADIYRKETYGENLVIINEVGGEQTLYFRQLYEVEKMMGLYKEGERIHVAHGLYRFKEGKMSTREGNVIWLEDIIAEATEKARQINPESAEDVAIGALKFNDLKRDSPQDIIFSWEEMLTTTGDSGPYLQYSAARARSAIAKAEGLGIKGELNVDIASASEIIYLEKLLIRFPETVERAGKEYKPNIIATYLISLAAAFNNFYAHNIIADAADPIAPHRLALASAFDHVMTSGLTLLGIKVPKKM